jgi:AcrR family transcriptional regulator
MAGDWLNTDRAGLAVERILDAAGQAYAELGVQATSMVDIATSAGCSRATVYAYFPNRRALQQAFLNRQVIGMTQALAEDLEDVSDPGERLVEAVVRSVQAVRSTPSLAAWFQPADLGLATELSSDSEVLAAVIDAFAADLDEQAIAEPQLAARWVIRTIISLISMPGRDAAEERALVTRCMVPGVLAMSSSTPG